MKNDSFDNKMNLARIRLKIPDEKLLMGSTIGKYPVILDEGRTIVYISDKSKERETRQKYELLKNSRFPTHF